MAFSTAATRTPCLDRHKGCAAMQRAQNSTLNVPHALSMAARPPKRQRLSHAGGPAATAAAGAQAELSCAVGIDLGTTNSAVALIEGNEPVVAPNSDGRNTTPSVVAFTAGGDMLVGTAAKRQAATNPRNTFYSVKRFIGQEHEDVTEEAARVAFSVMSDDDGAVVLECDHSETGQVYPEEVSAFVLGSLLEDAQAFSGRPVTRAVISVPAYFTDEQREATIAAGRLAGLEKIKIVREPVAAALAYGLDVQEDQTVLVFDLGGGTYDVSLLEVGGGVIEVLSTGGDARLGGDDWDAAIMGWLVEEHLAPKGVDCSDPMIQANLKAVAEAAKIRLSSEERVVIRMPLAGGIEAVLTRQAFEGMTADLFRRARLPLDQACWQAGVDLGTALREYEDAVRSAKREKVLKQKKGGSRGAARGLAAAELAAAGPQLRPKRRLPVGAVLLVGGATRMPAVQRFVRNMTGLDAAEFLVDPDLAVALGAAVQAGIYEGQVSNLMVMDVWQAALMRAYARQVQQEQQQEAEAGAADDAEAEADDEIDEGSDGEPEDTQLAGEEAAAAAGGKG